MRFWPFWRRKPESLTPEELRHLLIQAADSNSKRKPKAFCHKYRDQVTTHVDFLRKPPRKFERTRLRLTDTCKTCVRSPTVSLMNAAIPSSGTFSLERLTRIRFKNGIVGIANFP